MTSFANEAKAHLAEYKRTALGVTDDGVWARNGRSYPHILPSHLKELNVLAPYREEFWQYAAEAGIRLHSDFHHLNSSQALAFNLFFPALVGGPAPSNHLVWALTNKKAVVRTWGFEAVPDPVEGTNFDLLLELDSGGRVYVEVKFTETTFGTAIPDDSHRRKLDQLYRPRLGATVSSDFLEEAKFFPNYQLFRNISHARPDLDAVVFVVPARNRSAASHAELVLASALLPGVMGVRLVTVESIVEAVTAGRVTAADSFTEHYRLLREKYQWAEGGTAGSPRPSG
jgi:hypothetical protein